MRPTAAALSLLLSALPAAAQVPPASATAASGARDRSTPQPELVPYEEGEPVPPGARVVTRMRVGLIAAGASIFGSVWFYSVLFGSIFGNRPEDELWLAVPIAGPLAYAAARDDVSGAAAFWLAVNSVVQCAGVAMLVGGLVNPVPFLARDRAAASAPRWTLTPGFAGGPGASLRVTF